jgi:hypothetical protein
MEDFFSSALPAFCPERAPCSGDSFLLIWRVKNAQMQGTLEKT